MRIHLLHEATSGYICIKLRQRSRPYILRHAHSPATHDVVCACMHFVSCCSCIVSFFAQPAQEANETASSSSWGWSRGFNSGSSRSNGPDVPWLTIERGRGHDLTFVDCGTGAPLVSCSGTMVGACWYVSGLAKLELRRWMGGCISTQPSRRCHWLAWSVNLTWP